MTKLPVRAGPAVGCGSARLRAAFWDALTGTWSAALTARRYHWSTRAAQRVHKLLGVGDRLIAEAVVSTPLGGTLTRKNAGYQRPPGDSCRDIDG
jgi:hypothetical protein